MIRTVIPLEGQRLIYLRDLLRELIARDIKVRYKDSALGVTWSFISPLLHLFIFYFLFKIVLALNIRRYSSFAFSGMLVWTWFQASLSQATSVVKSSRELIRQPGFPVAILPVVSVSTNLVNFLIALPILVLMLVMGGSVINLSFFSLPVVMLVQFALTLGLAYLVAAITVVFRDTQHIIGVLLQLFFFLTPVFYEAKAVPQEFQWLYSLNPMVQLVEAYRAILMQGVQPNWLPLLVLSVLAVMLLHFGFQKFMAASYRFVEEY